MTTDRKKVLPRQTPPVDAYYMARLLVESAACKDPDVQHSAILVDSQDRHIAFGTNYMLRNHQRQTTNWDMIERQRAMVFAEEAVIDRALRRFKGNSDSFVGTTLYTIGPVSLRSMRRCIAVGIRTIIYGRMKSDYFNEADWEAAQALAKDFHVDMRPFEGNLNWLRDRIKKLHDLF